MGLRAGRIVAAVWATAGSGAGTRRNRLARGRPAGPPRAAGYLLSSGPSAFAVLPASVLAALLPLAFAVLAFAVLALVPLDSSAEAIREVAKVQGRILGAAAEEIDAAVQ